MKLKLKLVIGVTAGILLIGITVPMAISGINNKLDGEYDNYGTWTINEGETKDIEGIYKHHVAEINEEIPETVDFDVNDPETGATLLEVRDAGIDDTIKKYVGSNVETKLEITVSAINSTAGHVDFDIMTIDKPLDHEKYVLDVFKFMPLMIVVSIFVPILYFAKDVV